MPVYIKSNKLRYKKENGEYVGVDVVAEQTTQELIERITEKSTEVISSIPSDYTELSNKVDALEVSAAESEDRLDAISSAEITDEGKVLAVKTIEDGQVKEWDYKDLNIYATKEYVDETEANIVLVQEEQPTEDENKIWIKEYEQDEVQMPTYEEFQTLSVNQLLAAEAIPNSVQDIIFNQYGEVDRITYTQNNTIIRTDVFTFSNNEITEVRTLNTGESLTITVNTETLQTIYT